MNLLWRCWRSIATVLCFACFLLGGMVIGAVGIPLVWVLWHSTTSRRRVGRMIVRSSLRLFVLMMRATGVVRVHYEGLEGLRTSGHLVLANHPTLIDFILLASVIPQLDCVVKSSLLHDWFHRWPVMLAGYISNGQGQTTLARCRESLNDGNNIIIFPEGTRSTPGAPVKFLKGAAQVAIRIHQDVVPVIIKTTSSNLHKGGTWYLAPPEQVKISLLVQRIIPIERFLKARQGRPSLAASDLNEHLQLFFNQGLSHAGA